MEGEGTEEFIEALKGAVVPRDRKAKGRDLLPPVLLLAEGERAVAHAHQAMRGLSRMLYPDGAKRVPYAALGPDEIRDAAGRRPLTLDLGRELCVDVPRRTGRLRLTDFFLTRDIVEQALDPRAPEPDGRALRDHCYARRIARGPLLRALWTLGGESAEGGTAGPGWVAELRRLLMRPLFQLLPRWWWGRRRTRLLLRSTRRGWYADWRRISHGRTAEDFFENAARLLRAERGRDPEAAIGRWEELLLHALLADLRRAARPGRISPWRRRRRTRCVFLLPPVRRPGSASWSGTRRPPGTPGARRPWWWPSPRRALRAYPGRMGRTGRACPRRTGRPHLRRAGRPRGRAAGWAVRRPGCAVRAGRRRGRPGRCGPCCPRPCRSRRGWTSIPSRRAPSGSARPPS
ncbi:hypothetical protein [Streptomyces yatensis]|uniref:Uncharacterized protein n=1 Tax=Streptomyces yatensis TaxID=155177 RepID=A0ABN2GHW3_9ACTN